MTREVIEVPLVPKPSHPYHTIHDHEATRCALPSSQLGALLLPHLVARPSRTGHTDACPLSYAPHAST